MTRNFPGAFDLLRSGSSEQRRIHPSAPGFTVLVISPDPEDHIKLAELCAMTPTATNGPTQVHE